MDTSLLPALALFALASSITPGPNNMMLLASGANFGFRRTLPHMLGVAIGFTLMILLVGLGLMQVLEMYPAFAMVLKGAALLYLMWLAVKIARAGAPAGAGDGAQKARPLTFLQAAGFQWLNPKAWGMALSALAVYAPGHDLAATAAVAAVFGAVNLPCISVWTALGQNIRRLLATPARLRAFNIAMALMLVASTLPAILA